MSSILFTEEFCQPENLYPFTLTRQLQDIRVGILTIREKWEQLLSLPSFDRREDDYKDLGRSVSVTDAVGLSSCIMLHGNLLPDPDLVKAVRALRPGEFLSAGGTSGIAYHISRKEIVAPHQIHVTRAIPYEGTVRTLQRPWDIFQLNDWAIRQDFADITRGRVSEPVPASCTVIGNGGLFIEKGARLSHCIINTETGPIYIGRDAEVMEGSIIRGPFALCDRGCVKMGAKIYGATTVGPQSIVAGEVKNAVLFGYSNKAHDGYLGDSVLGEWCNLGAGTSNSNLKNNAGDVRIWTPTGEQVVGLKCGVLMGDYSRTAINTSINTGTVVGVSCHVAGAGLTPKYIPNFSWGSDGVERYQLHKALKDVEGWKKLKNQELLPEEKTILQYIFDHL